MGSLDRSSTKVLRNNKCLLCSVLDASEVLPEAAARGLLSQEETGEVQRCEAPMAKFLDLLLERRTGTVVGESRSPIGMQGRHSLHGPGKHSSNGENLFNILLEVLELKEEYRAWAKYLKDEYDLVEAQRLLDESKEVEEGGAGDETLIKGSRGRGSREFRKLARLSQNVDMKVRSIRTDLTRKESQVPLNQQPLSNSAKLLKEFKRTTRISERDVRLLLNLYKGHCDVAAVRDSSMKSLLHIAVEMMGFRVVKMMMEEFNFEPNEQDISGNTPLHVACLYQKVQIVMHLLSVPYCDPNVQNGEGMTPLNVCARVGSDVVTKHLFNCRRVDKNIQDYEGKTAVEIMDANNSMLVRGSEEASVSSPPVDTTLNLGVELGLLRGTEIQVKHKKLHAMLVSQNPKWKMGDEESWFMPGERDTNNYNISPFLDKQDVVLRDKHGLHYNSKQAEGNLSVVRRRKTKTREEWLHGVILKVDLWRSLCFLLVSIVVGVAICIILALLLIWKSRDSDTRRS